MMFRIEFPESKSKHLPTLLRACGKIKDFQKTKSQGFYSVTLDAEPVETLHAIFEMTKPLAGSLYYCDDVLVTQRDVYQKIWALRNKGIGNEKYQKRFKFIQAILPEIIDKKNNFNPN